MSQDNTAVSILSNPSFAANLKKWVDEKQIHNAMRGHSSVRDRESYMANLVALTFTNPRLFDALLGTGKTHKQIAQHYYNKLTKNV